MTEDFDPQLPWRVGSFYAVYDWAEEKAARADPGKQIDVVTESVELRTLRVPTVPRNAPAPETLWHVEDAKGQIIADVPDEQTARLIVRAVNSLEGISDAKV